MPQPTPEIQLASVADLVAVMRLYGQQHPEHTPERKKKFYLTLKWSDLWK